MDAGARSALDALSGVKTTIALSETPLLALAVAGMSNNLEAVARPE
jgi:hypothetical protein